MAPHCTLHGVFIPNLTPNHIHGCSCFFLLRRKRFCPSWPGFNRPLVGGKYRCNDFYSRPLPLSLGRHNVHSLNGCIWESGCDIGCMHLSVVTVTNEIPAEFICNPAEESSKLLLMVKVVVSKQNRTRCKDV